MEASNTRSQVGLIMPAEVTQVVHDNKSLIREYLEWKDTYTRKASKSYSIWVRRFQEFTNAPPEETTVRHWTEFAKSLREKYASGCVQFALAVIHNYLRFWHEQGRLTRFPLYLARVPKACLQSHNAITETEYQQIIGAAKIEDKNRLRDLAIIMLLHDTGMRVGELAQLEVDQLDEDSSATIRTEKSTKYRKVFWNADTDVTLQRYLVERINSGPETDWLFASNGGLDAPITTRTIQRIMSRLCRLAGITRHLSPHSFRHAFIHRLAALGVPDAILAQLVGHGSPLSISHYTKLSRKEFEDFARKQFGNTALAA